MVDRHRPPVDVAGVLEAARLVRGRLPVLVGPAAADVDTRLATLLGSSSIPDDVAGPVEALLRRYPGTAGFLEMVLADSPRYRPPEMQDSAFRGGGSRLAGDVGQIAHAGRYRCLRGDFVWYRPEVGAPWPIRAGSG
jgi:hypothetical protein